MAVLLALFIRTFVVQAFKIPSGSMLPTLQIGDHLLVNKFLYGIRIPIVGKRVFRSSAPQRGRRHRVHLPGGPTKDFIKRVKAVAGETIEIRNKVVFINGQKIDDPHAFYEARARVACRGSTARQLRPVTVPEGQVFVMGDNRDHSSRQPLLGYGADRRHPRQGFHPVLVLGRQRVQPALGPDRNVDPLTV